MAEVATVPVSDPNLELKESEVVTEGNPSVTETTTPATEKPKVPLLTLSECNEKIKALSEITKPDSEAHAAKISAKNDEINQLKEKIERVKKEMDSAKQETAGKKSEFSEARKVFDSLKAERDAVAAERDIAIANKKAAFEKFNGMNVKKREMKSESKFNSIEEVDREIKKLQFRQQTVTMKLNEEKRLLKEIQALKDCKALVSQLGGHQEETKTAQEEMDKLKIIEQEQWTRFKEINEKFKAQAAILDKIRENQAGKPDPYQDLLNEKKKYHDEIGAHLNEKSALMQEFKKKNDSFNRASYEIRQLNNMKKKIEYEARKAAQMEQRRLREEEEAERKRLIEEEEAKKIPYEEEMALCDQLVSYLTVSFGTKKPSQPKEEAAKLKCTKPMKENFEGKALVIKKRDDSEFISAKVVKKAPSKRNVSLEKKPPAKKSSTPASASKADKISHSLSTIDSFNLLDIEAPNKRSNVPEVIVKLKEKKEWYSKQPRGSVPKLGEVKKETKAEKKEKVSTKVLAISKTAFPSLPGSKKASFTADKGNNLKDSAYKAEAKKMEPEKDIVEEVGGSSTEAKGKGEDTKEEEVEETVTASTQG